MGAKKTSRTFPTIFMLTVAFVATALFVRFFVLGGTAPTPALFDASLTLTEATTQSESTGKPVFLVATSDSCLPCQVYKRGALVDERVVSRISTAMIPVYLDVDQQRDALGRLQISSIPATRILVKGEVAAALDSVVNADELLEFAEPWIETE